MDGARAASPDKPSRTYRSPRRAQQARRTRERILAAATSEFLAVGYAPTTMRAVATAAGVSLPTVELAFGNKAQLLKAAIDVAIAGDDQPVPVLQREWAARAQATTTVEHFLAVVGDVLVAAEQRSAGLVTAAFEAARSDPTMAALAAQLATQRATTVGWIVDGIMQRAVLRGAIDRDHAIDTIWLLMDPVVFCRLTGERSWTPERFKRWFTDSIPRLLLGSIDPKEERKMTTVMPELSVRRGRAAIEFYKAAFGAVEDYRVGGSDDHEAVVAQLSVGGAAFWVADESPEHANHSPESLGGSTTRMLLIVDDPASVLQRAVDAGATAVRAVSREHGWLLGRIADPFGHHWEIGKPLIDWPPQPTTTTVEGTQGHASEPS